MRGKGGGVMGCPMRVIGLMSGTSLDGVDVAVVDISGLPPEISVVPAAWGTFPFDPALRRRILDVSSPGTGSVDSICALNFEVGEALAQAVLRFLDMNRLDASNIDLIASHGQTIHHIPPAGGRPGSTLQIGEPSILAERTGITTVADFRPRDMAAGGHGAPLVPYVDFLLFGGQGGTRVVQNIGGIANLSMVNGAAGAARLLAFDTGPGNMVIDGLMERFTQGSMTFDRDGLWASAGTVSHEWLTHLLQDPYFQAPPPKSTGREYFGSEYIERLIREGSERGLGPHDIVATATMLTVETIAQAYENWIIPRWGLDEVILGGGGASNPAMVGWLRKRLPHVAVTDHDSLGIPNDAKEAIAFGLLGYLTVAGRPNNLPSATGAHHPVVMGKIVPGSNWHRVFQSLC